jgi:hypothetical protein
MLTVLGGNLCRDGSKVREPSLVERKLKEVSDYRHDEVNMCEV